MQEGRASAAMGWHQAASSYTDQCGRAAWERRRSVPAGGYSAGLLRAPRQWTARKCQEATLERTENRGQILTAVSHWDKHLFPKKNSD